MTKNWLTALVFSCAAINASSQTLFTYGKYQADASEFIKAFNKNNQATSDKTKAMQDYLGLYINSRLKIREAYDRGYDTLQQIKSEVEVLRGQIIDNYMSDPDAINRLTKEAFDRSLKDIHAAHIFISYTNVNGLEDTVMARKKLDMVMSRLAKGEDFMAIAAELSDDPSAKANKGDLNYITVFTLPYEFETIIYNTAPGKYSSPYTSKVGYHIFKNIEERKALGTIKAQQILLAFPPGSSEAAKKDVGRLADSLYQRILKGDDFAKLASKYSNDYVSASAGSMADVSIGDYEPAFEKALWALTKDGAVSKPFLTSHGYHIVKRISAKPVVTNPADKANIERLQQKVKADDRWKTARDFIYNAVKAKPGVQRSNYTDAALWAYTDSVLYHKPAGAGSLLNPESAILNIGNTAFPVADWINYVQTYRYKPGGAGIRSYPELMDDFRKHAMYQYYRDHLEDYNEDFRNQMTEFRDGNLFFEIMQQEVWNKAQADSVALLALYEKNKSQYNWKQSADAVIFFCSDEASAKSLTTQLRQNPSSWKKAVDKMSERVVADSARFEWAQIPGLGKATPAAGSLTTYAVNKADNTASFAYITKVYTTPSPRSFNEAKGLVMNDYQNLLEEEWVKNLKKKYPVTVNEKVFAEISK